MTSSPVQHAAGVPGAAAAPGAKTVAQLPVAAQALQPSTPAPEGSQGPAMAYQRAMPPL